MAEGPQVYRTEKVESLEHYRKRYENAGPKERKRMAMLQAEAIHHLLLDISDEVKGMKQMIVDFIKDRSR